VKYGQLLRMSSQNCDQISCYLEPHGNCLDWCFLHKTRSSRFTHLSTIRSWKVELVSRTARWWKLM
jgi:hypothetical protein